VFLIFKIAANASYIVSKKLSF